MLRGGLSPSDVTGIQVNAQNQDFGQNAFSRTSTQNYHDGSFGAQDTGFWVKTKSTISITSIRGAGCCITSRAVAGGGDVAVNIPGFAFFGREPFSFVQRVEQRHQISRQLLLIKGRHSFKFGADINHLPITADFTVNFGGIYNFGELTAVPSARPSLACPISPRCRRTAWVSRRYSSRAWEIRMISFSHEHDGLFCPGFMADAQ